MESSSGRYFCFITVTVAILAVHIRSVHGESRLQSQYVEPKVPRDQSYAETSISKVRLNRSPKIYEPWPRRKVTQTNSYNRHVPETYDYRTSYQAQNYKTIDVPRREEPDFWPTPMQHHIENKPQELPKMFYLKPVNHDRRPYSDNNQEFSSWRHNTRFNRPNNIHANLNEDGTYRLPGPRPQSPRFRQLEDRPPQPRQPNVQVSYDYDEQRRPFQKQQIETDLSLAIARFVHQHLAQLTSNFFSRGSEEPEMNDIEVFVRFVDRKKRHATIH